MEVMLKVPLTIMLVFLVVQRCGAMRKFVQNDNQMGKNFGSFYHTQEINDYVYRVMEQSEEIDKETGSEIQSCFTRIYNLDEAFQVCKRYLRSIIQFCQTPNMAMTTCKNILNVVKSETQTCLSSNLHTELCQFLVLVKSQKDYNFQHVSRLTSLLREFLEKQGVCYVQPQPFQKYQPQRQGMQCPQMNQVWPQRFQTPQYNRNKQQWFQSESNMNWQQWNPPGSDMKLDFPQGSRSQQRNLYFTEDSQSQWNQDWSNSKKSLIQPQLQGITGVQTLGWQDLVEVHTLPIGQGDCNIITCNKGENVILFDCGSSGANILKYNDYTFLRSYFEKAKFLAILISHGHKDHYNQIERILTPSVTHNIQTIVAILGGVRSDYTEKFMKFLKTLKAKGIEFHEGLAVGKFCEDSTIYFDFIDAKTEHPYTDKNQRGMLMKLTCKGRESSLLFAGDMEGKAAEYLAKKNVGRMFLSATHYKMAHHGASNKANSEQWLKAVSPVEVHVSHKFKHGSFRHPRCEAYYRILKNCPIGTDGPKSHKFTCYEESWKEKDIWYRVYSTAPVEKEVCLISLVFSRGSEARTGYYCAQPNAFYLSKDKWSLPK